MRDDRPYLRADRAELKRLIAACDPDDVTRLGFQSRLEQVEAELAALERLFGPGSQASNIAATATDTSEKAPSETDCPTANVSTRR